ncbi:MAG: exosortase A [Alphaproteobacteria bacterium]|jgi:exosortase A
MNETANNDYKKPLFAFAFALAAWLFLVSESLWSAIGIWIGNEIYNHCLIVIPASLYLIYERRYEIDWAQAKMSWLALVAFIAQLALFILGSAADIQLFQHLALFTMLPTLVWLFIGNRLAWDIKFPLVFVLFAVPVGEELIPILQEITADMSVFMLKLSGIPLFRSGLFIEIPQGKFLVAEACSGVSFLIASIVLGNLYAYMNLVSWKRRVFFVCLSIIFPIVANSVRVYGIIYIGYATDMEHAVGADHLIYGWFFFALVLVCLFLLGEIIRMSESKKVRQNSETEEPLTKQSKKESDVKSSISKQTIVPGILIVVIGSIGLAKYQDYRMQSVDSQIVLEMNLNSEGFDEVNHNHRVDWKPRFADSSREAKYHFTNGLLDFDLFYAYFSGEEGELVSSLNRLYEQDRWTLVEKNTVVIEDTTIERHLITTSNSIRKELAYWYVVDGNIADSFFEVKLLQLLQKLKGEQSHSFIVIVAIEVNLTESFNNDEINKLIADIIIKQRLSLN